MKGSKDISKSQLISMIHFLEERDEESMKENEALKELIKELQEPHNQKVKSQTGLLASIDRLTMQVADLTEDNMKLQQQIDELQKQIKQKRIEVSIKTLDGLGTRDYTTRLKHDTNLSPVINKQIKGRSIIGILSVSVQ